MGKAEFGDHVVTRGADDGRRLCADLVSRWVHCVLSVSLFACASQAGVDGGVDAGARDAAPGDSAARDIFTTDAWRDDARANDGGSLLDGTAGTDVQDAAVGPIFWGQTWAGSTVENVGAALWVQGEIYSPGITDAVGQGAGVTVAAGIGPRGSHPSSWVAWQPANYLKDTDGGGVHANDLYGVFILVPSPGAYDVALRVSAGATVFYADGAGSANYDPNHAVYLDSFGAPSDIDYCNLQWPAALELAPRATAVVYGQIYVAGLTDTTSSFAPALKSELGVGPAASDPRVDPNWFWVRGAPNGGFDFSQNNDEHLATLAAPETNGTFAYAWRVRKSEGWTYCDKDGAGTASGLTFSPGELGVLMVR